MRNGTESCQLSQVPGLATLPLFTSRDFSYAEQAPHTCGTVSKEIPVLSSSVASEFIAGNFFYVFIVFIGLNLYQRRFKEAGFRKRTATLIHAVSLFLVFAAASVIAEFGAGDIYLVAVILVVGIVLATVLRERAFPFRRKCAECGTGLDFNTVLFRDDNLCAKCSPDDIDK